MTARIYYFHDSCLYDLRLEGFRVVSIQVTLADGHTVVRRNWSTIPGRVQKQLLRKIKANVKTTQAMGQEKT